MERGEDMRLRFSVIVAALSAAVALSGCAPQEQFVGMKASFSGSTKLTERDKVMLAKADPQEWSIPIVRREVSDPTGEAPGTIVIYNSQKKLYLVGANHRAMEYPVAVGAEAFGWTGRATVGHKTEWPTWMPTASIMSRWPEFKAYIAHGPLEGRYDNPLGARALYLSQGNHDTLYRIHGTNEPEEIGQAVSSGCIRMRDLDVIDLYNRVKIGAQVVVKS
jgi:lipoprotein-anchoring transpeptidase ErfK/SrfK